MMTAFPQRPLYPVLRRGFSAVEIIAVATIMAILALILIPIIGHRVEKAKVTAAQEDLVGLGKAITLAFADTGHYFRLQDYDNTTVYTADTLDPDFDPALEVPVTYWNTLAYLSQAERGVINQNWQGPYIQFHRAEAVGDLARTSSYQYAFTVLNPDDGLPVGGSQRGPIVVFQPPSNTDPRREYDNPIPANSTRTKHKYPVDPWGSPYLFFGPGQFVNPQTGVLIYNETIYVTPILYCLGPNGLPGNTVPARSEDFLRVRPTPLGTEDDLVHEF